MFLKAMMYHYSLLSNLLLGIQFLGIYIYKYINLTIFLTHSKTEAY